MDEMNKTVEKQDSIKISKTSRGFNWEQKRYFDSEKTPAEHVIDAMKATEGKLLETFPDENGKH